MAVPKAERNHVENLRGKDGKLRVIDASMYSGKTERLITTVLGNLDVQCGRSWADALDKSASADNRRETDCYSDTRRLRDDPYATMRW